MCNFTLVSLALPPPRERESVLQFALIYWIFHLKWQTLYRKYVHVINDHFCITLHELCTGIFYVINVRILDLDLDRLLFRIPKNQKSRCNATGYPEPLLTTLVTLFPVCVGARCAAVRCCSAWRPSGSTWRAPTPSPSSSTGLATKDSQVRAKGSFLPD